jgi:SET domain-containing protein
MEQPWFELRRSSIQGRGAFATRRIPKRTRIAEYVGEHISHAEADRRYDDEKMARHHTFLFTLSSRTVIDGAVGGNDSRYINHSCEPNCEAVIEGRRIFIYALRDIAAGEELVYDYRYERDANATEADEKMYVCHCGAPTCRGSILAPPAKQRHSTARRKKTAVRKKSRR